MIEDYFFTKNTKWVLWGAFAVIFGLLIFHAGYVLGQQQPVRGRMLFIKNGGVTGPAVVIGSFMPKQGYVESGHGAVGTIATITLPTIILEGRDGLTQTILAGTSTVVTGGATADTSALQRGEAVIVIGDPDDTDDGYLDARIIHILPASPVR